MTDKEIFKEFLESKPIAYYADFSTIVGSTTAGVLLSQLLYWTDKGVIEGGWIYKTQSEWKLEIALSRREQETARKKLRDIGILQELLAGNPAKLYYKIDFDKLIDLLGVHYVSMAETRKLQPAKLREAQTDIHSKAIAAKLSLTKNTKTENTAETASLPMHPNWKETKENTKKDVSRETIELSKPIYKILHESVFKIERSKNLTEKIAKAVKELGADVVSRGTLARIEYMRKAGKDLYFHSFITDFEAIEWQASQYKEPVSGWHSPQIPVDREVNPANLPKFENIA